MLKPQPAVDRIHAPSPTDINRNAGKALLASANNGAEISKPTCKPQTCWSASFKEADGSEHVQGLLTQCMAETDHECCCQEAILCQG